MEEVVIDNRKSHDIFQRDLLKENSMPLIHFADV